MATDDPVGLLPGAPRGHGGRIDRVSGCGGSEPGTRVEGARVDRPGLASLTGTVVDGSGWRVQIVVSVGDRSYRTTAAADGSYSLVDVPPGHATVAWSATGSGGGTGVPTVGEARRDGSLGVDLTAGANHVDIQL